VARTVSVARLLMSVPRINSLARNFASLIVIIFIYSLGYGARVSPVPMSDIIHTLSGSDIAKATKCNTELDRYSITTGSVIPFRSIDTKAYHMLYQYILIYQ